jgi:branched-chain amino acid transport system ATP-binding protein
MEPSADRPLLEVLSVSKRYGSLMALRDVSFSLREGEILGLIGPNGAGKTTMVSVLSGSILPSQGEVRFDGRLINGLKPHRVGELGIARTFQLVQPFTGMTALECTMLGALFGSLRGRLTGIRAARRHAEEVLTFVGLAPKADILAENLNIPERRRLELARALAARPRLLLLDEVMAGLNAAEVDDAITLIRSIRDRGMSVLVIEHLMQAILGLADRVVVLHHGNKIADGPAADVMTDERIVTVYLGSPFRNE